jgi:protein-L-isoaspartate(D-aspartate) O-methyltransferase
MDSDSELAIVRNAYAKQVLAAAGVADAGIERAFASVSRERFLGPGPWKMYRLSAAVAGSYGQTPDADPVYVYVDQVVGLISERGVNNGQPSLHARLVASANIQAGEHVVHIGAGTGYYSAIMAQLVGPTGRVEAIECDPALAARARENLSELSNVTVLEADGSVVTINAADVIYVNAGVTHPAEPWLEGLGDGGRLIIPLTTNANFLVPGTAFDPAKAMRSGAYFHIQRQGPEFEARCLLPTMIIPAQGGARDDASERALAAAFAKGGWQQVTKLIRNQDIQDDRCWLKTRAGWSLTYR